jgi:hypothetical protein
VLGVRVRYYDVAMDEWRQITLDRGELVLRSRYSRRVGQFGIGLAWHTESFHAVQLGARLRIGSQMSFWLTAQIGKLSCAFSLWWMR